jgi:PAS domain S-box-containing protein/putative nucleotidyltransferase with HDIG domain
MAMSRGQSAPTPLQRLAIMCAAGVMLLGLLGLAGWFTGLLGLAAFSRDYIPMASSTAWSFLLLGLVLTLHGDGRLHGRGRWLLLAPVILTTVFGFLNFLEYFIGIDLSYEDVLFPTAYPFGDVLTNRMSPATGCIMFLSGVGAFLILRPSAAARDPAAVLGSIVSILGLIGATGYLFGTPLLQGGGVIPMALTTSLAFLVLGVGLTAAAGPESWLLRALAGPSVRARLLRVFLPLSVAIIIAQGWLHQAIPGSFGNPALTAALLALGFAGVMVLLVTVAGRAISHDLDRAEVARQQAEAALRESEERFRAIFEQAAVGVAVMETATGRFLMVNQQYCDIVGLAPEEMTATTFMAITHPDHLQTDLENMGKLREGLSRQFSQEERYHRKDVSQVWVNLTVSPMWVEGETPNYYIAVVEDITKRKMAEAEVRQGLERLHRSLHGTVAVLANVLETKDPYTAGHQRRVAQLASALARELGWSEDWVEGMHVQGLLHDLGKIAVPTEILSRPGKISQLEFNLIKSHSEVGYDILKGIAFPWPVAQAVLQHHERLDGSGYPAGLTAPEIIPEARVLAVADVVEAMSSHRPYRPGLGVEIGLEEITRNRGKLYDPQVVDACVRLFTEKDFAFDAPETL